MSAIRPSLYEVFSELNESYEILALTICSQSIYVSNLLRVSAIKVPKSVLKYEYLLELFIKANLFLPQDFSHASQVWTLWVFFGF